MNNWEDESIQNFVKEFIDSNAELSWKHIQAKNGKKYLLLLAEEGSYFYNKYFEAMIDQIPKGKPAEY